MTAEVWQSLLQCAIRDTSVLEVRQMVSNMTVLRGTNVLRVVLLPPHVQLAITRTRKNNGRVSYALLDSTVMIPTALW